MSPMVEKVQIVSMLSQRTTNGSIFDAPDQEFILFVNYLSQEQEIIRYGCAKNSINE